MSIENASAKLIQATEALNIAKANKQAMQMIVIAEQTGFDRLTPMHDAVMQAEVAEEWASTLLVRAIRSKN